MRRNLLLVALLVLVSFVLAACDGAATPEPSGPMTVRVTLNPFLSNAPFFIAQEEGYFEEQGLEIEFVTFDVTADAFPALVQGDIDVWGGQTTIGVWNAMAEGAPVKVVANKGYYPANSCYATLLGSKELEEAGGLSNPDAIYGKQVAYVQGSFAEYWFEEIFAAEGLDLTQVEAVSVPIPSVPEVIGQGNLVLAVGVEPTTTFALRSGNAYVARLVADDFPDFEFAHIMFGPSILDENPEMGRRFMAAYLKGVRQYAEGKTERNLEILNQSLGLDMDILEEACWPDFRPDISVDYDNLALVQSWGVEKGYQDVVLTAEQTIDMQFVEYALETLGE